MDGVAVVGETALQMSGEWWTGVSSSSSSGPCLCSQWQGACATIMITTGSTMFTVSWHMSGYSHSHHIRIYQQQAKNSNSFDLMSTSTGANSYKACWTN